MDRDALALLLINDYAAASEKAAEAQLWKQCHYARISGFRAEIAAAKKDRNSQALLASTSLFRAFLDDALLFYSQLTLQLASVHGLKRVLSIVRPHLRPFEIGVSFNTTPVSSTTTSHKPQVFMTCFQCLIYLGDLARYRDSTTNPSPLPKHYYLLAHKLLPSSGNPFNQLAVLPLTPGPSVDLIPSELYVRALCCKKPFVTAKKNLEVCLGKPRPVVEGIDGVLEACRLLLLNLGSSTQEWSNEDFDSRIKVPLLSSFALIFATRTYDIETLARIARLLIGVSEIISVSSSRRKCLESLLTSLLLISTNAALHRLAQIKKLGVTALGYSKPMDSIQDVVEFARILVLHFAKFSKEHDRFFALNENGEAAAEKKEEEEGEEKIVSFWEEIAKFCSAVQEVGGLDEESGFNHDWWTTKSSTVLEDELVGFTAVDGNEYVVNGQGAFDDSNEMNVDIDDEDDENDEEVGGNLKMDTKIAQLLQSFLQISRDTNVPLSFNGSGWRCGVEGMDENVSNSHAGDLQRRS
ncbi:hypothetical protein BCR33DRAFT_850296 [Rhizoclosmatium globosum]|uniref:Uncharacterized protein n=1 Tax=Rhizoclosmatium globosum TaxID=329046 RepID=A0A1Y2CCM2_9FUNG|nr:hypothetical protein BCR33DRAFT_850296 [Rhizoclosmatium globosum]|eukprot:ORY44790.1 hypothetical protein BCR33DRAFT_850296 [Rhizoclosmatium globosum]